MTGSILILGGHGRLGRNATEVFKAAGWRVRQFDRTTQSLDQVARGVDVILNAWNPPYSRWQVELPRQASAVIEAAQSSGATLLLPGNVYVYGPEMPELLGPETPHRATHPLGELRRQVEESYRASGLQVLLLRAGDFLDIKSSGNWFDRIIAKDARAGRFAYPGRPDIPHAWAFLPDLALALVALAEARHRLDRVHEFTFEGTTLTGHELCDLCAGVTDTPLMLHQMSWLPVRLARPFWSEAKYLLEMRYLWDTPHQLDGAALAEACPRLTFKHPDHVVRAAMRELA